MITTHNLTTDRRPRRWAKPSERERCDAPGQALLWSRLAPTATEHDFDTWLASDNGREVWRLFVQYACDAKAAGRQRYSAKAILERIRWHVSIETAGDAFKINNNWAPDLARKLARELPDEFADFFETRERRATP